MKEDLRFKSVFKSWDASQHPFGISDYKTENSKTSVYFSYRPTMKKDIFQNVEL